MTREKEDDIRYFQVVINRRVKFRTFNREAAESGALRFNRIMAGEMVATVVERVIPPSVDRGRGPVR